MIYDLIIIGGGAAGLSAAIFAGRKKLNTVVITSDIGGQTNLTPLIENYPGTEPQEGLALMKKFHKQAEQLGIQFTYGKVTEIKKEKKEFTITLANHESFTSKALIIAYGKTNRTLGIPGESEFLGRGVGTCIAFDKEQCQNKRVVIVGGGNSAVEAALQLTKISKEIHLIHRSEQFRADGITGERVKQEKKVKLHMNQELKEITGKEHVESVILKNNTEIKTDMVFIEIGYVTNTDIIKHLVEINEKKEIIIDSRCQTSCEGLFAAGDITTIPFKQTVVSAGEGAKAALQAYLYLTGGKIVIDWTH